MSDNRKHEYPRFECPRPVPTVSEKWADGWLVTFPSSYTYNGCTVVDGKFYRGYYVPDPIVPEGMELVNIGVGLQLNARPPYATEYLRRKDRSKLLKRDAKAALQAAWRP